MTFLYNTQSNERDTDGVSIPANAIVVPEGGSIKYADNLAVDLKHEAQTFPGHKINPFPDAPSALAVEVESRDTVNLTWEAAPDHGFALSGYEYRYQHSGDGEWKPDWTTIPASNAARRHLIPDR